MGLRLMVHASIAFWIVLCTHCATTVSAQQNEEAGQDRVGEFEITVKTTPPANIRIEDLALDPDQDKKLRKTAPGSPPSRFLYRVRQEGYMGFNEEQWVERIQFKTFSKLPDESTGSAQYRQYVKLAELLSEVAQSMKQFKEALNDYYHYGTRLIDFCDDPLFKSISGLDATIAVHLARYNELARMRQDITEALKRRTVDAGCKDVADEYRKKLYELRDSLNNILIHSRPLREKYDQLKKESLHGSHSKGPTSATGSPSPPGATPRR